MLDRTPLHLGRSRRWAVALTALSLVGGLAAACSSGLSSAEDAGGPGTGGSNGSGASASGSGGNKSGSGGASTGSGGSGNGNGGSSATGGNGSSGSSNGTGGTTLGPGGPALGERSSANVLFSGHSLLDNPMPDFTAAIATARGDTLNWEQQNVIGSPIRVRTRGDSNSDNWTGYRRGKNRSGSDRDLLAELANPTTIPSGEKYDTLLITERHDPIQTIRWEDTVGYILHYHDRLAERHDTARTLVYQVWPDIDKANPAPWVEYQSTELVLWECIVGKINLHLEGAGRERSLAVIPGSQALARLVEATLADEVPGITGSQQQKLDALFTDNVHLTHVGQYFMAAVHYSALFGKPPSGANAGSDQVPSNTAAKLEEIAWQAMADYFDNGQPLGRTMEDCRTRVERDVCPAFYTIRGNQLDDCTWWSSAESPFRLPDSKLPLPAP